MDKLIQNDLRHIISAINYDWWPMKQFSSIMEPVLDSAPYQPGEPAVYPYAEERRGMDDPRSNLMYLSLLF